MEWKWEITDPYRRRAIYAPWTFSADGTPRRLGAEPFRRKPFKREPFRRRGFFFLKPRNGHGLGRAEI